MTTIYTGLTTVAPASMAPASRGNVYGVNGLQRGFVCIGATTAYPIGVTAAAAITATSTASPQYYYVTAIEVTDGGENYNSPPSVSVSGVTGEKAELDGSQVSRITFTASANTFVSSPAVTLTGGQASGASAKAILRGGVASVALDYNFAMYTTPPDVTFTPNSGCTAVRAAKARTTLLYTSFAATSGRIGSVIITDQGQYEWDGSVVGDGNYPLGAAVAAGIGGFTPILKVDCAGVLASITSVSGGTAYSTPPTVSFLPKGPNQRGSGAFALASVSGSTVNDYIPVTYGTGYDGALRVAIDSEKATATAVLAPRLSGKYLCGVRLVGSDGVPGNFCPLVTVDCGERASSIIWNLTSVTLADGSPNRIQKMELWRTTGGQAITLYKVTEFSTTQTTYTDTMADRDLSNADRSGFGELRILTEDGFTNAYRHGVPPSNMSVVTMFGDRAWYAVDTSGTEPNTIYFSALDEPEAVASDAQIVIQTNGRDSDSITGLMPFDGVLYVGQKHNIVRLVVAGDPYDSASATPVAQRGLLNDRCWDRFGDTTYIVDSAGLYAFQGNGADPLSDPVSDYWDKPLIDFSKSKWFFVQVNHAEKVVRFHFVPTGSSATYPDTALCYSLVTKSWWIESYGRQLSAKVTAENAGRQVQYTGSSGAMYRMSAGTSDAGTSIAYSLKTGNYPINKDPKRNVRLTYTPCDSTLSTRMYYNGSASPRPNAVAVNPGSGFVTTTGSTQATLNMAPDRSALGTATGFAQLALSGRIDDRSAGGDRTVAVEFAGVQGTTTPVIHSVEIEGVG
jgi:hypothetical protein